MTKVYITIDTEYSAGLFRRLGAGAQQENFDRSIRCKTAQGDVGIGYQMDVFDRYGLKAVFFVDPMPALVWGIRAITDIVQPILARGHDVQLHCHTEWLVFAADNNPLIGSAQGRLTGQNIKDFALDEQRKILRTAADLLVAAGASYPIAFRAGNYGANDDTLHALASLGISYDSSHCPGIAMGDCAIGLPKSQYAPIRHCGVNEIPIGAIGAGGNATRHAQITALSAREMIAAIGYVQVQHVPYFTLVSHSFELMSRDRSRINRIVKHRFEEFCRILAGLPGTETATYRDSPPQMDIAQISTPLLPHSSFRTAARLAEQAASNALYGAR